MPIHQKFKKFQKNYRNLFYILIFSVGFIFSTLAAIEISEFFYYPIEDRWEDIYKNVISNVAAGLFLTSMMYFLIRKFEIEEDDSSTNIMEAIKVLKTKFDAIEKKHDETNFRIKNLEFTGGGSKPIFIENDYAIQTAELIKNATNSVLYIGDGFYCSDSHENESAEMFLDAVKSAINNGISLKYFQWGFTINLKWLSFLQKLKSENSIYKNLKIHIDTSVDNIPHPFTTIIVDAGHDNESVCIKFTKDTVNKNHQPHEFGVGFIFKGSNFAKEKSNFYNSYFRSGEYSMNKLDRLYGEKKLKLEQRINKHLIDHPEKLDPSNENISEIAKDLKVFDFDYIKFYVLKQLIQDMKLYLATGLEMNNSYFAEKCKSRIKIDNIAIPNYKIAFNVRSKHGTGKGGGIINMVYTGNEEDRVWGVVYAISYEDYKSLTQFKIEEGLNEEKQFPDTEDHWSSDLIRESINQKIVHTFHVESNEENKQVFYPPKKIYQEKLMKALHSTGIIPDYRNEINQLLSSNKVDNNSTK